MPSASGVGENAPLAELGSVDEQSLSAESKPGRNVSDATLLRRLRAGDEDAATQMYVRYATRLHALARRKCAADLGTRLDAEDIVQSVFRTFFRRAGRGEYQVPAGDELWKLLLVISLNKIRKVAAFHRAAKRDVRKTADGGISDALLQGRSVDDPEALGALRLVIEETLADLPMSQRHIVIWRIEGYEVAEIAARSGRSKRSVERILQGFRQSLAAIIHEGDPDD